MKQKILARKANYEALIANQERVVIICKERQAKINEELSAELTKLFRYRVSLEELDQLLLEPDEDLDDLDEPEVEEEAPEEEPSNEETE